MIHVFDLMLWIWRSRWERWTLGLRCAGSMGLWQLSSVMGTLRPTREIHPGAGYIALARCKPQCVTSHGAIGSPPAHWNPEHDQTRSSGSPCYCSPAQRSYANYGAQPGVTRWKLTFVSVKILLSRPSLEHLGPLKGGQLATGSGSKLLSTAAYTIGTHHLSGNCRVTSCSCSA